MMPEKGPAICLFYECGGVMLGAEDGGGEAENFVMRWRGEGHGLGEVLYDAIKKKMQHEGAFMRIIYEWLWTFCLKRLEAANLDMTKSRDAFEPLILGITIYHKKGNG
jgi:hypothetical protein